MNRDILIPRRRQASRFGRFVCKYRYYRSIGMWVFESASMAWRASR